MIRECEKVHIPEPVFNEENGVVKVLFELAEKIINITSEDEGVNDRDGISEGLNEGLNEGNGIIDGINVEDGVSDGINELLLVIMENPGQRVPVLAEKYEGRTKQQNVG